MCWTLQITNAEISDWKIKSQCDYKTLTQVYFDKEIPVYFTYSLNSRYLISLFEKLIKYYQIAILGRRFQHHTCRSVIFCEAKSKNS